MFSFFDYLRRQACDAILAGAYDAAETLASGPVEEPAGELGEKVLAPAEIAKPAEKPEPPKKISSVPAPVSNAPGDLFSQPSNNGSPPALPPRKRGRPPKNPPPPSGQQ